VLCSESDPVAIAHTIHRIAFGTASQFVTCDPKRKSTTESVRWTQNFTRGSEALAAAAGGTLCVWASRLPADFADAWAALVAPTATVRLVVCSNKPIDGKKVIVQAPKNRVDFDRLVVKKKTWRWGSTGTRKRDLR